MQVKAVQLEGRTAVLFYLAKNEYNTLKRKAEEDKVSMTLIVRHLVDKYLIHQELGASAKPRGLGFVGIGSFTISATGWMPFSKRAFDENPMKGHPKPEAKKALVIHFADEEYKKLDDKYGDTGQMTLFVRNLIRTKIMGLEEIPMDS